MAISTNYVSAPKSKYLLIRGLAAVVEARRRIVPGLEDSAYCVEVATRSPRSQRRQLLGSIGRLPRAAALAACEPAQSRRKVMAPATIRMVMAEAISCDLFMAHFAEL
jgi:hypothetical protein